MLSRSRVCVIYIHLMHTVALKTRCYCIVTWGDQPIIYQNHLKIQAEICCCKLIRRPTVLLLKPHSENSLHLSQRNVVCAEQMRCHNVWASVTSYLLLLLLFLPERHPGSRQDVMTGVELEYGCCCFCRFFWSVLLLLGGRGRRRGGGRLQSFMRGLLPEFNTCWNEFGIV